MYPKVAFSGIILVPKTAHFASGTTNAGVLQESRQKNSIGEAGRIGKMRRNRHTADRDDDDIQDDKPLVVNMQRNQSGNLTCSELIEMSPAKQGYCDKKDTSLWAYFFSCWLPPWKRRYFVLLGGYLYRFSTDQGESLKGVPIPLDCSTVRYVGESVFEVSMIRKSYLIRADTEKEALDWVNAINTRKFEAIKENMGHAPLDAATRRANKVADFLFNKKLQNERKVAERSASTQLSQGHAPF